MGITLLTNISMNTLNNIRISLRMKQEKLHHSIELEINIGRVGSLREATRYDKSWTVFFVKKMQYQQRIWSLYPQNGFFACHNIAHSRTKKVTWIRNFSIRETYLELWITSWQEEWVNKVKRTRPAVRWQRLIMQIGSAMIPINTKNSDSNLN